MIIIRSHKVLFDKKGVPATVLPPKNIAQWKNDANFKFDIFKPLEWREFLEKYRFPSTGKLLPRFSASGDPIAYEVYTWGTSRWMKDAFPQIVHDNNKMAVISLFPGYTKDGIRRKIAETGAIR